MVSELLGDWKYGEVAQKTDGCAMSMLRLWIYHRLTHFVTFSGGSGTQI